LSKKFNLLTYKNESFYVNCKKEFSPLLNISKYISESVYWAVSQKYFKPNGRDNNTIIRNSILGKLGEFFIYDYFNSLNYNISYPDLKIRGKGMWDDGDLILEGRKLSIKSTHYYNNMLLINKNDWTINGEYKWGKDGLDSTYKAFFLCRIKPNIPFLENTNIDEIITNITKLNPEIDCPGYLSIMDFKDIIDNEIYINKGDIINNKIKIGSDFYYCQAGDLNRIETIKVKKKNEI
jgi:hypothetical protein